MVTRDTWILPDGFQEVPSPLSPSIVSTHHFWFLIYKTPIRSSAPFLSLRFFTGTLIRGRSPVLGALDHKSSLQT